MTRPEAFAKHAAVAHLVLISKWCPENQDSKTSRKEKAQKKALNPISKKVLGKAKNTKADTSPKLPTSVC